MQLWLHAKSPQIVYTTQKKKVQSRYLKGVEDVSDKIQSL
jgi:hypothetical protein